MVLERQILVLDDDKEVRSLLRDLFVLHGYDCQVAENGQEGLELFRACRPPVAIVDVKMPVMDGLEFLKAAQEVDSSAAIIMLTGAGDVRTGVDCMKRGAADFLLKPINMEEILAAVERALERRQLALLDRQQQAELERRAAEAARDLSYIAQYDALTGLANRALFRDRLRRSQVRADRGQNLLGLMLLDVDRFKEINDTLGHDAGDVLLTEVAQRLRTCVREVDSIARLGGDEFAIVLESLARGEDAALVAERILASIAAPIVVEGRELFVTTSVGMAVYPTDAGDVTSLVKNADTALYRAKEEGRNTYRFYTPDMNAKALERLAMEASLRRAVEREEFVLYYQPRIDLRTGRITGAEALIRWLHPERGLVPPGQFIPLAEESGVILPMGEWALRAGCAQNRAWQDAGLDPIRVGVNISARQFRDRGLREGVARALRDSGLAPAHLELELTEGLLMENTQAVIATLGELKAMGLVIAIDDFGTGYSSLSYLKRFPIDALKIDQSFVRGIPDDPDDVAIASAIIALARALHLKVVAEGVETQAQVDFLRGQACDEVQGYFFSRPVPAEEFARLLSKRPW